MKPSARWLLVALGAGIVVVAMTLVVVLVARDDDGVIAAEPSAPTSTVVVRSTTSERPTTTARGPDPIVGSGQPVRFAFGGDVHFEGPIERRLATDPASIFGAVAPIFGVADLSMVNLETALTERGTPANKQFTFRAPVGALDALRSGNIDVVSMANNHAIDFGPEGLEDSLIAKETSGFPIVGVGRDASAAYAPWRTEINGQRIAVFGASEVIDNALRETWSATDTQPGMASAYPEAIDRLLQAVATARADSDTVIVYLHYGRELEACPNDRQRLLAERLTAAGADIVVGSHAHRLQGGGRFGDAFVDYGLGNFAFYNESGAAGDTGVLWVQATGRRIDSFAWLPARIEGGAPTPLVGPPAEQAVASWNALRDCTGLAP